MHEFAVAEEIVSIIRRELGGERELDSVALTLGPLSGINADSLRFCFSVIAEERGFGRPELLINSVPARLHCNNCGREYELRDMAQVCPECGSMDRRIESGSEFTLDAVEFEEEELEP